MDYGGICSSGRALSCDGWILKKTIQDQRSLALERLLHPQKALRDKGNSKAVRYNSFLLYIVFCSYLSPKGAFQQCHTSTSLFQLSRSFKDRQVTCQKSLFALH